MEFHEDSSKNKNIKNTSKVKKKFFESKKENGMVLFQNDQNLL